MESRSLKLTTCIAMLMITSGCATTGYELSDIQKKQIHLFTAECFLKNEDQRALYRPSDIIHACHLKAKSLILGGPSERAE